MSVKVEIVDGHLFVLMDRMTLCPHSCFILSFYFLACNQLQADYEKRKAS